MSDTLKENKWLDTDEGIENIWSNLEKGEYYTTEKMIGYDIHNTIKVLFHRLDRITEVNKLLEARMKSYELQALKNINLAEDWEARATQAENHAVELAKRILTLEAEYADERAAHNKHATELIQAEGMIYRLEERIVQAERRSASLIQQILEQERERDKLKSQLEAKLVFISKGDGEDRYDLQERLLESDKERNRLKKEVERMKQELYK